MFLLQQTFFCSRSLNCFTLYFTHTILSTCHQSCLFVVSLKLDKSFQNVFSLCKCWMCGTETSVVNLCGTGLSSFLTYLSYEMRKQKRQCQYPENTIAHLCVQSGVPQAQWQLFASVRLGVVAEVIKSVEQDRWPCWLAFPDKRPHTFQVKLE